MIYTLRTQGFVGNGKSNPLKLKYKLLSDAQKVWPHAVSLEDETDWCAIQGTIDALAKSGGGQVELPAGSDALLNRKLVLPKRTIYWTDRSPQVNITGAGRFASRLTWRSNFDTECIGLAPTKAADEQLSGLISDLSMAGPLMFGPKDAPSPGFDGIALPDRLKLRSVSLFGFRNNLTQLGGQAHHEDVQSEAAGDYALYYRRRNPAHHGDSRWTRFWGQGRRAVIGVHSSAMVAAHFDTSYFGGSPYVAIKETGDGLCSDGTVSTHAGLLASGLRAVYCQFESIGEGLFLDLNDPRKAIIRNAVLDQCTFIQNDKFKNGAPAANALIDCAGVEDLDIRNPINPWKWEKKPLLAAGVKRSGVRAAGLKTAL